MIRHLILTIPVYSDEDPLPPARKVGDGIREALPSAWFTSAEGDDLWLGDGRWQAHYAEGDPT